MDWSLIIFVVVIGLFAWRGFRSGFIKSLGRVCAVLAGYSAAILFSGQLSAWIELHTGWQGVVAFLAASLTLFFGAGFVVMLMFSLLRRFVFPGKYVSTASAIGGGSVGAVVGILLAIAIVWSFTFVRDMWVTTPAPTASGESSSGIEALASHLAGSAISAAMSAGSAAPEVARLSGALMASPAEVTQRLQRLMESAELQTLMADPANHRVLDGGNPEEVRQLPAFRALVANPDLLALAQMAGYGESGDIEAELAQQLTDTWGRAQRVKNDPRVQAILTDPEFRATLDSGNPVALLSDYQVLELAEIIFADEAAAPASPPAQGQPTAVEDSGTPATEATQIYQWTDSSGRIHYSDQQPEN